MMGSLGSEAEVTVMMLNGEQLKTLAKLIHYQERHRMKSIRFSSEKERARYLRDSQAAYRTTTELIDQATELHEQNPSPSAAEVALQYLRYVEKFFNTGLRLVWNLYLRLELIFKMRDHAVEKILPRMKAIFDRVGAGLGDEALGAAELERLKEESKALVKTLAAYEEHYHQLMINKLTPGPRYFSKALKSKAISFEELVKRHQLKLVRKKGPAYAGPFEKLEITKQIEVYDDIVVSSRRASLLKNKGSLLLDSLGLPILLLTVGIMAWDIYSSDHKIETAAEEGAELVGSVVGGFGGELVGAAVGTAIATTAVGTETAAAIATAVGCEVGVVTSGFICLTAAVTGIGAGLAVGALVGWLVGKIIERGGKHDGKVVRSAAPQQPKRVSSSTHNIRMYVVRMPDVNMLARQIAFRGEATC